MRNYQRNGAEHILINWLKHSYLGSDGLRFIKDGIHIGPEGIATITGEHIPVLMPISKNSL